MSTTHEYWFSAFAPRSSQDGRRNLLEELYHNGRAESANK